MKHNTYNYNSLAVGVEEAHLTLLPSCFPISFSLFLALAAVHLSLGNPSQQGSGPLRPGFFAPAVAFAGRAEDRERACAGFA